MAMQVNSKCSRTAIANKLGSMVYGSMGFADDFIDKLRVARDVRFGGVDRRMAQAASYDPTNLGRLLKGEKKTWLNSLGRLADAAGLRIVFEEEQDHPTSREVCFVHVDQVAVGNTQQYYPIESEDYIAAPLAAMDVAAGPGLIPAEEIDGWVLVYKHESSIRHRSDLAAFRVGVNETSMVKTIHPGEIVLVDRADWRVTDPPGNIYLVRDPEGALAVKRASLQRVSRREQITFYSDNEIFPPRSYDMAEYENDLRRAIVGRIVWSWSDMTRR